MVFPSHGCITCKQRHIKCDSVHPACGRCQKASRACVWDESEAAGLLFKSENAFAQGKPRRPWKPKSKGVEVEMYLEDKVSTPEASYPSPIEDEAHHFWLETYVFKDNEIPEFAREYTDYLKAYWDKAQPGSSLRLAVSAFSLAVFGRAMLLDETIGDVDDLFSQSIAKMQDEFHGLSHNNIDELLATTMLMAHYENIRYRDMRYQGQEHDSSSSGSGVTGSRFWKDVFHHRGAADLLKLRQEHGWPPNLSFDRAVRRQLIRAYILRAEPVDAWLEDGAKFGEEGPVLDLDLIMIRIAGLRSRSLCLFFPKSRRFSSQLHPPDVAAETQELNGTLMSWSRNIPEGWKFSTQSAPILDVAFDGLVHVYATYGHATIWNRYRAIHLIVNSLRKRALIVMSKCSSQMISTTAEQEECQEKIASLATDLCRSVSSFFGPRTTSQSLNSTIVGGMDANDSIVPTNFEISPKQAALLAWPLTLAVSTDYVPDPQKHWLKGKLKSIANALGGDTVLEAVTEQSEFQF